MSEPKEKPEQGKTDFGYTPSSPVKRSLAWIGLVYVLILLGLTTYFYFTGTTLGNLAPLLAVPGLIGLGILALVGWRTTGRPGKWVAIIAATVCWLLAAVTIPVGIVGLLSNFGQVGVTFLVF